MQFIHSLDSLAEEQSMDSLRGDTQDSGEKAEVTSLREDKKAILRDKEKNSQACIQASALRGIPGPLSFTHPGKGQSECPRFSPGGVLQ